MSDRDVAALLAQYRAGLEAELVLLGRLEDLAGRQRTASDDRNFPAFTAASDKRETLMTSILTIERGLSEIRPLLAEGRDAVRRLAGYDQVVALHKDAAERVARILGTDGESMKLLAAAVTARQETIRVLDQADSTLAAYKRAMTMPSAAALIDRRG